MKKIIDTSRIWFLTALVLLAAASCNKNEDLMTDNVKTGGLVQPTATFFYKLGITTQVDIDVTVPTGPQISEIYIYNKFVVNDTTESNEILYQTIPGVTTALQMTYAQLREGLTVNGQPLPASDTALPIGSSFVLRYEVKMADGRRLINLSTSTIGISNFFAGKYQDVGVFNHPVNGPRAINEEKNLVALNAFECKTTVADLSAYGYEMKINIDPVTNVAKVIAIGESGSPELIMQQDKESKYDPATGVITLHYFYVGGTGNRVIDETYTPK